jgi:hypothetical protein
MTIPTGGFAALLVVATFALTSCGGDDGAASATTTPAPAAGTAQATQTTAPPGTTATQQVQTTTAPATTSRQTDTSTTETSKTTAAATPSPAAGSGGCGPVEIGAREGDVELTYARITSQRGVSCQTVTIVAQQWGGERIGIAKALLPNDWECRGSTCSGPKGSFSFKLYRPS